MVVLLRAFTHVAAFEEELERVGLRPYVVGGRGYWSQQQVEDARRLLATIANPLDDLSLLGTLASPACGVRPDALWLLRQAARGDETKHLWPALERRFGSSAESDDDAGIPTEDGDRLRRFCERLERLRDDGPRLNLEELVQQAITVTGYDLAVLMMPGGERRYANLRKLMRLAREYEVAEGRDLRGFLDYLEERSGREDPEGEAATEAEEHDGVRLMTVHAAKGLEFPVVAVADLGRRLLHAGPGPGVRVDDQGADPAPDGEPAPPRMGIRLARFGATAVGLFDYDELADEAEAAEAAESCRLAYVAATRARDRLLLSGCYSAKSIAKPVPEEGLRPGTPIAERLIRALEIADGEETAVEIPAAEPRPGLDLERAASRIAVRFNPPDPEAFRSLGARPPGRRSAARETERPPLLAGVESIEPSSHRLSYSALATFGSCGYRFYAERILGLSRLERDGGVNGGADAGHGGSYGFGSAVHAMLEWSARHGWREPPREVCVELLHRQGLAGSRADLDRAGDMVAAWLGSELRAELAGAGSLRPEMPFLLPAGGAIVRGNIDLLAQTPDGPVVVDYKTDSLAEASAGELVERYGVQRAIYALAAAGGRPDRVRTAYAFLDSGGQVAVRDFEADDLATASDELERLVTAVKQGRFEVTEEPHAALCWDCPARARLCAYPTERTGARR
jgi:ATP-dependent exoDNAse (exonuclease V) beta subunit